MRASPVNSKTAAIAQRARFLDRYLTLSASGLPASIAISMAISTMRTSINTKTPWRIMLAV
jgi:hypothetical protein